MLVHYISTGCENSLNFVPVTYNTVSFLARFKDDLISVQTKLNRVVIYQHSPI
jgi:hypothetical protein